MDKDFGNNLEGDTCPCPCKCDAKHIDDCDCQCTCPRYKDQDDGGCADKTCEHCYNGDGSVLRAWQKHYKECARLGYDDGDERWKSQKWNAIFGGRRELTEEEKQEVTK